MQLGQLFFRFGKLCKIDLFVVKFHAHLTRQLLKCITLMKRLTINNPVKLKTAAAHSKPKVLQRYPPAIGPTTNLQQIDVRTT